MFVDSLSRRRCCGLAESEGRAFVSWNHKHAWHRWCSNLDRIWVWKGDYDLARGLLLQITYLWYWFGLAPKTDWRERSCSAVSSSSLASTRRSESSGTSKVGDVGSLPANRSKSNRLDFLFDSSSRFCSTSGEYGLLAIGDALRHFRCSRSAIDPKLEWSYTNSNRCIFENLKLIISTSKLIVNYNYTHVIYVH